MHVCAIHVKYLFSSYIVSDALDSPVVTCGHKCMRWTASVVLLALHGLWAVSIRNVQGRS